MLTLDEVLSVVEPKRVVASDAGDRLVVVTRLRRDFVMRLRAKDEIALADPQDGIGVLDLRTGECTDVTAPLDVAWNAVWAPGDQALVVLGEKAGVRGLWRRDLADGSCTLLLKAAIEHHEPLRRSGDEVLVLLSPSAPQPATPSEPGVTVDVFTAGPGTAPEEAPRPLTHRLVAVDPATGTHRLVAEVEGRSLAVSPDDRYVAVAARLRRQNMGSFDTVNDVDVLDVRTGECVARVEAADQHGTGALPPSWAPDGSQVATVRDGAVVLCTPDGNQRALTVPGERVGAVSLTTVLDRTWVVTWLSDSRRAVVRTESGELHLLDTETGGAIRLAAPPAAYLLRDAARGTVWTPLPDRCVVVGRRDGELERRLSLVPLDGTAAVDGPATQSWMLPNPSDTQLPTPVVVKDELLHVAHDNTHPPEVVALDGALAGRQVSRFNDLPGNDVVSRTVTWTDGRDRPHLGFVLLPTGYDPERDGTIPVVVDAYPGGEDWPLYSEAWEGSSLCFLKQLGPARGWAYFVPGMMGVTQSDSPEDLLDPVVSGLDELARLGIADHRAAIIGQSQGGYLVNTAVTVTSRFAAAISFNGLCDMVSTFGQLWPTRTGPVMHGTANAEGYTGGPPWELPERYVAMSPIFHLDKVTTPLMIVGGTYDYAAFMGQGDELYVGLRRLGKEVVLLRYRGEFHGASHFTPPNRDDVVNRVLAFLDDCFSRPPGRTS